MNTPKYHLGSRPIAIGLSPNTEHDDSIEALKILVTPWKWIKGDAENMVKKWLLHYFSTQYAYTFNSARSALYILLRACGIGKDDEVIIQAFTCVAVPNSIHWTNATPVYVDIDERYNIDPKDLQKKITKHTKAVIVQHTFGIPAEIDTIQKICEEHKVLLIEDCAHSLGASYKGKKLGTWGDASIFSFGRDKVVSSVFGGALIINAKSNILIENVQKQYTLLSYPSMFWTLQQLLHPICMACILPMYSFGIGKVMLVVFQKLHLLSFPVEMCEKEGCQPRIHPTKYPNALAQLLVVQLQKLERYNNHRISLAKKYYQSLQDFRSIQLPPNIEGAIWHRFPIQKSDAISIIKKLRKNGIYIGNWYHNVIDPKGVIFDRISYVKGSCPNAEAFAEHILNLPTYPHITNQDCDTVIDEMK
jgi:perosamine synthetase